MSFDQMRIYDSGRIYNSELPDWYHEACRISEQDKVDWHRTLDRVLGCEHSLLTEEGLVSAGLEIRFWPSEMYGVFVVLETPLALVEQIVILNPADWLPFLSTYLAPLMFAVALNDQRLTWPERELVRQLGEKLYGKRKESCHD